MKYFLIAFSLFIIIITISCSDDNPASPKQIPIDEGGGCFTYGLHVHLDDTVSYDFAVNFFSQFDSVEIIETHLTTKLYMYADSGDYNYWSNFYLPDTLLFDLESYINSDSLILVFQFLDRQSYFNQNQRIKNNLHLQFIKSVREQNYGVLVDVPEGSEQAWLTTFEQYTFIDHVDWIAVCN